MTARDAERWRKRALRNLPVLSQRVFALRAKFYRGCGFHWTVERSLGRTLAMLNDYDSPFDTMRQISAEIGLESLYRTVAEAEKA